MAASPMAVLTCKDGSYCCGNGTLADACCQMDLGLFVVNGSATPRNSASSIVSRTASASETSSSPTSSASFSERKTARETKTGAIVGGTIGGVAVLVLGALIWKCLDRRKLPGLDKENEAPQSPSGAPSTSAKVSIRPRNGENTDGSFEIQEGGGRTQEMNGSGLILELDSARTWHEMR